MCQVSVITPVRNGELHISDAIQSVLAQTYANFELLIVDDASTDNTPSILSSYADKDSRIKVISLPFNAGPSVARNFAIQSSLGRFLAFLDADDFWYPSKLEEMIKFYERCLTFDPCTVFICSSYIQSKRGFLWNKRHVTSPPHITFDQLKFSNSICTSTVLVRQDLHSKKYFPNYAQVQDWAFWLALLREDFDLNCAAYCLDKCLVVRNIRSDSVSSRRLKSMFFKILVLSEVARLPIFGVMLSMFTHNILALTRR